MNYEKLWNLAESLKKIISAMENVEDGKIKTPLIEAAKATTKEIFDLLG